MTPTPPSTRTLAVLMVARLPNLIAVILGYRALRQLTIPRSARRWLR
jgi:hypothetical protein